MASRTASVASDALCARAAGEEKATQATRHSVARFRFIWIWRDRIKTLQRQAMRRKEVPTRLKDAIGELWQMGRTYARGNARKAAELRQRIKVVLEE